MTTEELETALSSLHALLAKGSFIEAMEQFLAEDVVLEEVGAEPKHGKANCIAFETKVLEDVDSFEGYTVSNVGFGDDTTFYSAVMKFTQKDGTPVVVDQCVVDCWRDGEIVSERFYHA